MTFERVTYVGPPIDDAELLGELPPALAALLGRQNGFVAYGGGLHVRGACSQPEWHSLRRAWRGPESLSSRFPVLRPADVPFAQDALGDQYVLSDNQVCLLNAETGHLSPLLTSLDQFLQDVASAPVPVLSLGPLLSFEQEGGKLLPGQLLSVYPPFAVEHDGTYSYRAVAMSDRLGYLASLAEQLHHLGDDQRVRFGISDRVV